MKLAAVGSNCIDFYANLEGGKAYPGGGPVNMAVYTVRLGGQASYIGPVGDDKFGSIMAKAIREKGVDVSHLHVKSGKTAVSQVELIDGERVFGDYDEGVLSDYVLSEDDINFILKHDMVVCDLWGKVEGQYKDLKEKGITTVFDCATRPEDEAAQIAMPYTDILFFSEEEDSDFLRQQMIAYAQKGPKLVVAMLGTKGSLCYDHQDFHSYGIVECDKVVDTMGAGDSYIAGFLSAYQEGNDILTCMHKGAANATETLKYFGAW